MRDLDVCVLSPKQRVADVIRSIRDRIDFLANPLALILDVEEKLDSDTYTKKCSGCEDCTCTGHDHEHDNDDFGPIDAELELDRGELETEDTDINTMLASVIDAEMDEITDAIPQLNAILKMDDFRQESRKALKGPESLCLISDTWVGINHAIIMLQDEEESEKSAIKRILKYHHDGLLDLRITSHTCEVRVSASQMALNYDSTVDFLGNHENATDTPDIDQACMDIQRFLVHQELLGSCTKYPEFVTPPDFLLNFTAMWTDFHTIQEKLKIGAESNDVLVSRLLHFNKKGWLDLKWVEGNMYAKLPFNIAIMRYDDIESFYQDYFPDPILLNRLGASLDAMIPRLKQPKSKS